MYVGNVAFYIPSSTRMKKLLNLNIYWRESGLNMALVLIPNSSR